MPLEISFVATAVLILLFYSLGNRYIKWQRLRHVPGPFWARITHAWIIRHVLRGSFVDMLVQLHSQYGPVVILAPDFVSLSDPAEIRRVNKVRSNWGRAKGYYTFRFTPGTAGDSIASVRDNEKHARIRVKLAPGYTGKTIDGVEQIVDKHIMELVNLIETKYLTSGTTYRPVDFARLTQYLSIDIITSFAFQESFSCLRRDDDFYGYLAAVNAAIGPLMAFAFLPFYHRLMDTAMLGAIFPDAAFIPEIFNMARRQVSQRFEAQDHDLKDRNEVLSTWVAAGLGQKELVNETVVQLGAGGETTSTGIRAAMLYLMTSPRSYHALQQEIDAALESTAISCPLSEQEVVNLPYLQAVVKETLRLFMPAAFFPKSSPNEEILCGLKIPAGVSVEMAYKPALRTKEIFGEDANMFRPERWIASSPDTLALMDETLRFVFGGPSRWECLGRGLALMQMHKVLFELFRKFDFALIDPTSPWKAAGTRVWVIKNFFVQITQRDLGTNPP
ncbi:cytochrome P450 86A1 [Xylariales sp. PMI_506]|nr:cytochrome P450 86A1 [Xylariales sp. PMI_506]